VEILWVTFFTRLIHRYPQLANTTPERQGTTYH